MQELESLTSGKEGAKKKLTGDFGGQNLTEVVGLQVLGFSKAESWGAEAQNGECCGGKGRDVS
jgi:hypothetical protein